MANSLSRKSISRDGVSDRRARDALRLTEENFVQLFNEVTRKRFWSVQPADVADGVATNGAVDHRAFTNYSITANPGPGKAVIVGLVPTTKVLSIEIEGIGTITYPPIASIILSAVNCRASFQLELFRDGLPLAAVQAGIIGTSGTGVTGTYSLTLNPNTVFFVDDNPGGIARTYQLRWSCPPGVPIIAPPSTFFVGVGLSGCMLFAQEVF